MIIQGRIKKKSWYIKCKITYSRFVVIICQPLSWCDVRFETLNGIAGWERERARERDEVKVMVWDPYHPLPTLSYSDLILIPQAYHVNVSRSSSPWGEVNAFPLMTTNQVVRYAIISTITFRTVSNYYTIYIYSKAFCNISIVDFNSLALNEKILSIL